MKFKKGHTRTPMSLAQSLVVIIFLSITAACALAQAPFYRGKTVTILQSQRKLWLGDKSGFLVFGLVSRASPLTRIKHMTKLRVS